MGFAPFTATIGNLAPPLPVADGGTGAATAAAGLAALGGQGLQAGTAAAGFALQDATPTILTWAVPNDGQVHRVDLVACMHVTVAETGGQVNWLFNIPDGTAVTLTAYAAGLGVGTPGFSGARVVQAGSTVSLVQATALTAGTATLWAQIWAD